MKLPGAAMESFDIATAAWTAVIILLSFKTLRFVHKVWWVPRRLEQVLRKQGIKGPPKLGPLGNIVEIVQARQARKNKLLDINDHDILPQVFPDHCIFSEKYGDMHLYWWATEPRVNISNPELLREILSKKADYFGKSPYHLVLLEDLLGHGTVAANGADWAYRRKIVSPAFHMEKLKGMTATFVDCTLRMLERWNNKFESGKPEAEIEVSEEFTMFTSDVISHMAFGGSYEIGKRAFEILNLLTILHIKAAVYSWLPFTRWIPIKLNRDIWRNEKEVNQLLSTMVEDRREKFRSGAWKSYGEDLLGMILTESQRLNSKFDSESVIGECKTMHVAGNDTTSSLLTWTLFLLSLYPEWQDRARAEAFEICGEQNPDAEMIGRFKQIVMVMNESLRLYPPGGLMFRGCFRDAQIGEFFFPKGVAFNIPVIAIHHDKGLWGEDAHEFKPERFEQGASKAAKHPNAFMPFSYGPRTCVGMNLTLIEAKVALAIILRRFEFSVSPSYRHSPSHLLTLTPEFGMPLIFKRLE